MCLNSCRRSSHRLSKVSSGFLSPCVMTSLKRLLGIPEVALTKSSDRLKTNYTERTRDFTSFFFFLKGKHFVAVNGVLSTKMLSETSVDELRNSSDKTTRVFYVSPPCGHYWSLHFIMKIIVVSPCVTLFFNDFSPRLLKCC